MADLTILLATYNRIKVLKEALRSILDQEYEDYRVLIVDDGSSKSALNFIRDFVSKHRDKFSLIEQKHKGPASARALGLKEATTDYIYILDSDDILHKGSLRKVMNAFRKDSSVDLLYGDIIEFRDNKFKLIHRYKSYLNNIEMRWKIFLSPRVPFKHSAVAFRKEAALILGNYDENIEGKIDIDLLLSFLESNKIVKHLPEILLSFRMSPNSVSFDRLTGIKYWFRIIDKHESRIFFNLVFKIYRVFIELIKYVLEYIRYMIS